MAYTRKVIITLSLLFFTAFSQHPTQSAGEILRQLCYDACRDQLIFPYLQKGKSCVLVSDDQSGTSFYLPSILRALNDQHLSVFTDHGECDTVVTISNYRGRIEYPSVVSSDLLSEKYIERTISFSSDAVVTRKSDHALLLSIQLHASVTDTIPASSVEQKEAGLPSVMIIGAADASHWSDFFAPVILIAASGLAIYLFFTIRS